MKHELKSVSCSTSPLSTSFYFEVVDANKAKLYISHHNGLEYAPLHSGLITAAGLSRLQKRYDQVKLMGTPVVVEFDLSACRFEDNKDMACFHKDPAKIGDLDVKDYYFSLHQETNLSRYGEFGLYSLRFDYRINSVGSSLPMIYYGDACRFE